MISRKADYLDLGRELASKLCIPENIHSYFETHKDRLWKTIQHFNLLHESVNAILEIGPYFSYTPFLWQKTGCKEIHVYEGDSPNARLLERAYEQERINVTYGDLCGVFGDDESCSNKLPFDDNTFNSIICWETMEHFNFNPVLFVRDLYRVLRNDGRAYITVANIAKLDKRISLLFGKSIGEKIDYYSREAGHREYLFHWREYVLSELIELFDKESFEIVKADHLHTFQNYPHISLCRKFKRLLAVPVVICFPSFGTLCTLVAQKKSD